MAAQSWYRVGTAAVTNGSAVVTGTLTGWTAQSRSGDMMTFDGGATWYEVLSVNSNTSITLATNYAGSTASGLSYAINRTSPLWSLASELAAKVADLLDAINTGIISWFTVSGAPSAGVGNDGDYAIDPTARMLYGPKVSGSWPSGVSLAGDAGADGADGADGVDGTNGTNGADGVSAGLTFTFKSSTTMGDPGDGALRLDNATLASVTAIAIDDQSAASGTPSVKPLILTWDDSTSSFKGTLTIKKRGSEGTFAAYRVTGAVTDNTEWLQIAVSHVASAGTFSDDDTVTVEFVANGDSGSVGSSPTIPDATLASTLKVTGDLTPAQITSDQDDYNPSGLSTAIVLRLSTDSNGGAGRKVNGLAGGAAGRIAIVVNVGSSLLTLADEASSSSASNRFALPQDAILVPDESLMLRYDGTSSRWRPVAQRASGRIGETVMSNTESALAGTLLEDGSAVSRTTYAALFSVIGTRFGAGDGSTTFNVPDKRGLFMRGWANGSSNDPDRSSRTNRGDGTTGDAVGTKQGHAVQEHQHSRQTGTNYRVLGSAGSNSLSTTTGSNNNLESLTGNVYGGTTSTETRSINTSVAYCIVYQ